MHSNILLEVESVAFLNQTSTGRHGLWTQKYRCSAKTGQLSWKLLVVGVDMVGTSLTLEEVARTGGSRLLRYA